VQRRVVSAALAVTALLLTAGCSSGTGDPRYGTSTPSGGSGTARGASSSGQPADRVPPAKGTVKVLRTVTEGLKTPWGLAPLPDGNLLVSSRDDGTITRITEKTGQKTELGTVSGVSPAGEGGLLGIALSPDYASDHMIYAYFTSASDNRVVRMLYDPRKPAGEQLGAPDTIFKGIPKGYIHNGGRIAFGPDTMLYAGTGESGNRPLAQDKTSLGGKILRMTPDGRPAPGNPFPGSLVYSLGHRNVEGLAFDSRGRLWASEFGDKAEDELNLIRAGGNYGWPVVEGSSDDPRFVPPMAVWPVADASPSGIAIVDDVVYMAALRGQRLWRIPITGDGVGQPQAFLQGEHGRLRSVARAPDGSLWVGTSNLDKLGKPGPGDDRILRVAVG
jgi:glucose/arabinose dehydrogenase